MRTLALLTLIAAVTGCQPASTGPGGDAPTADDGKADAVHHVDYVTSPQPNDAVGDTILVRINPGAANAPGSLRLYLASDQSHAIAEGAVVGDAAGLVVPAGIYDGATLAIRGVTSGGALLDALGVVYWKYDHDAIFTDRITQSSLSAIDGTPMLGFDVPVVSAGGMLDLVDTTTGRPLARSSTPGADDLEPGGAIVFGTGGESPIPGRPDHLVYYSASFTFQVDQHVLPADGTILRAQIAAGAEGTTLVAYDCFVFRACSDGASCMPAHALCPATP